MFAKTNSPKPNLAKGVLKQLQLIHKINLLAFIKAMSIFVGFIKIEGGS